MVIRKTDDMTSSKPYLIRALHEWIVDNELTPYILVDAEMPRVKVPRKYIKEGRIVLNIAPEAVESLELSNRAIEFSARFAEGVEYLHIPIGAILAIYASENGRGMFFSEEEGNDSADELMEEDAGEEVVGGKAPPHLKIVK